MFSGKIVFAQLMEFVPMHVFRRCVITYQGNYNVRTFSCLDQFLCMAFAQLTYRDDANEQRDWRIYASLAQSLIVTARELYSSEPFLADLDETIYALDSTTIDLCLSMFPWATFRKHKAAIKLHTLLDLRGNIPTFINISDGKVHDVNALDVLPLETGAFYVMDRGYLDFARLYTFT